MNPGEAKMGPHDRLFKEVFEHNFPELLDITLPWLEYDQRGDPPRFLPTELHSPLEVDGEMADLVTRHADLVAQVRNLRGDPELVLVHTEIERHLSRRMAKRLFDYSILLRARHGKPVIPLVIFLSGGHESGIVKCTYREVVAGEELVQFHYFAFYLAGNDAQEYLERPEALAAALAALMEPGELSPARHKLECMKRIYGAETLSRRQLAYLTACVDTYLKLGEEETIEYERLKKEELMVLPETTVLEEMEQKGLQKGLRKGLRKGLAEGRTQGARRMLLRMLELRFGPLDEAARRQVENLGSLAELERLGERAFSVASLPDLGLGRKT